VKKMASVASFFISRIDTLVDSMLNDRLKKATDPDSNLAEESSGRCHRQRK